MTHIFVDSLGIDLLLRMKVLRNSLSFLVLLRDLSTGAIKVGFLKPICRPSFILEIDDSPEGRTLCVDSCVPP